MYISNIYTYMCISNNNILYIICITKQNLLKHNFITNFVSNLLMNQTHFFCFYTCYIIKSNE